MDARRAWSACWPPKRGEGDGEGVTDGDCQYEFHLGLIGEFVDVGSDVMRGDGQLRQHAGSRRAGHASRRGANLTPGSDQLIETAPNGGHSGALFASAQFRSPVLRGVNDRSQAPRNVRVKLVACGVGEQNARRIDIVGPDALADGAQKPQRRPAVPGSHQHQVAHFVRQRDELLFSSGPVGAGLRLVTGHVSEALARGSIRRTETRAMTPVANNIAAIRAALESVGVEFIPVNGGAAGVRMRKPAEYDNEQT